MTNNNLKFSIEKALKQFNQVSTADNIKHLFEILGYSTQRELLLDIDTADEVVEAFEWENFREDKGLLKEWDSVDCLFQVTEEEITQKEQLESFKICFDQDYLQSYIFLGLTLQKSNYSRSQLATITREINRQFDIPIMVLFRYGDYITLSIINRRPNKLNQDKDVLEKIILIKDININSPHRAHIQILANLSLISLRDVKNFDELHTAWQKVLDISELNKKFFQEVSNWYFWAISNTSWKTVKENKNNEQDACATFIIRLMTRLIFVWFLKEKGLVPDVLFDEDKLKRLLKSLESEETTYYKAILQNLFFATLNTEMNTDTKSAHRKFRDKSKQKNDRDKHDGVTNFYRYQDYFINSDEFLELCQDIPFLNGGLFECLDKASEGIRIDYFLDRKDNPLTIPNFLFFGEETDIDLNKIYGTRKKKYKVQGLINIFNRYKFTIDENTPIEEEIALDPELLGKVFENLLAEYNPETETTARKQTGSFYTPRNIVNYMVDESLIAYLVEKISELSHKKEDTCPTTNTEDECATLENKLRNLLNYNDQIHQFNDKKLKCLINAIDNVKIIDIACGSGAFSMGILQKLIHLLTQLDPNNTYWKEVQKNKVLKETEDGFRIENKQQKEDRLTEINKAFDQRINTPNYARKLFLIENCIFGVDIQPIAVQISKLRFFISLIVDQKVNNNQPNRGILPLPNLETKFVAANSLIGIDNQLTLRSPEVIKKEEELKKVRQQHFTARTPKTKKKCREKDKGLRQEISQLLQSTGLETATADTLARWNPYDLNISSDFFDAEWMFGVASFDICIGNPPYLGFQQFDKEKPFLKEHYISASGKFDYYVPFIELGLNILSFKSILCFICPTNFTKRGYGKKLRKYLKYNSMIRHICDFEDVQVFPGALNYTGIFIIQKSSPTKEHRIYYRSRSLLDKGFFIFQNMLSDDIWVFRNNQNTKIIDNINSRKISLLGDITKGISEGIVTGKNPVFLVQQPLINQLHLERQFLKLCIRGKEIRRYYLEKVQDFVIYPYQLIDGRTEVISELEFSKYQNLYHYLQSKKSQLLGRDYFEKSSKFWYELWCQRDMESLSSSKILVPELSKTNRFTIGTESHFYGDTVCGITFLTEILENILYFLGILNSSIIEFYYKETTVPKANGFYIWKTMFLKNIPIYRIDFSNYTEKTKHDQIVKLVTQILDIKRQNPNAHTSDLERKINNIVYQLYGLTEKEIRIIEESVKRK